MGAFIIQRNQNVSSVETIETIDSLVHNDCYQCFIFVIAALILRLIDCYSLLCSPLLFYKCISFFFFFFQEAQGIKRILESL